MASVLLDAHRLMDSGRGVRNRMLQEARLRETGLVVALWIRLGRSPLRIGLAQIAHRAPTTLPTLMRFSLRVGASGAPRGIPSCLTHPLLEPLQLSLHVVIERQDLVLGQQLVHPLACLFQQIRTPGRIPGASRVVPAQPRHE